MPFRPTDVRDTPKSAPPPPATTDRPAPTQPEPRLATPEELAIAIPLAEERPSSRVYDRIAVGLVALTGVAMAVGPVPELVRLLGRGAWVYDQVELIVLGLCLVLTARDGWKRDAGAIIEGPWLWAGMALSAGLYALQTAMEGRDPGTTLWLAVGAAVTAASRVVARRMERDHTDDGRTCTTLPSPKET